MEAVDQTGGCPQINRADLGTESVVIQDIQTFLCCHDFDNRSELYFWNQCFKSNNYELFLLRQEGTEYWIRSLSETNENGLGK